MSYWPNIFLRFATFYICNFPDMDLMILKYIFLTLQLFTSHQDFNLPKAVP